MTVCIAASCKDQLIPAFVLVLDKSLSLGGMTSVGGAVKGRKVGKLWHVMFAGDDISHAESVVQAAMKPIDADKDYSSEELQRFFASGYQKVRKTIIENLFLSSFGWTLEQFMKYGNTHLPPSEFSHLLAEIQRYDLGCEFLGVGFEGNESVRADMFHISNPGVATPQDAYCFAAIGSGAPNALAYLARRNQHAGDSLAETIYNSIAAKVLAEKALGIGRETAVLLVRRDGYGALLKSVSTEAIREIWEKEEENVRPANLQKRVSKLIKVLKFED